MSSEVVIRATDIAKHHQLYDKSSDRLQQFLWRGRRKFYRDFVALDGVSFEMRRGETVGILGRNGAGKSTLLQIICGTVTPSAGVIEVNGRISALLELGAGFNPEFTGRENVLLNAAILGLTGEQVLARFDDIAGFADIGAFIDQPVKTYSSGMYMRLAFSVAVHVNPDILVVDEALAVGDAPFQAKCVNRIRRLIDDGVSLLFVSHDLGATKALCSRALLLDKGRQVAWGRTDAVADEYISIISAASENCLPDLKQAPEPDQTQGPDKVRSHRLDRFGDGKARYTDIRILDQDQRKREAFSYGETLTLSTIVEVKAPLRWLGFGIHLRDRNGVDVGYNDCILEGYDLTDLAEGDKVQIDWRVPLAIANGPYHFSCVLSAPQDDASGPPFTARDVTICDFVSFAAHFRVGGEALLFGYLRVGELACVTRILAEKAPLSAARRTP